MTCLTSSLLLLGAIFTILTSSKVEGGLTLRKACGELYCEAHNFCSPTDHRCLPCKTICDPGRNNHDQNRCETDCQDYLHDLTYSRRGNESSALEMEIESELGTLKLLLGLTLSLTILVMLMSIVILLKLQLKRSGKTKKKPVMELPAVIYRNQQYEKSPPSSVKAPENNNSNNGNGRFRREPSESTLPEYSSYDNPALSPSPTHHV